ncbi:MAG: hypothetical protein HQK53_10780 [Oligoflexia bacterium]|nr:hypothetical protein [Oligoflexia bacterium]
MNLSLKNRVTTSFVVAILVIVVMGLTVFNFLDTLNKSIEKITVESNRITLLTDEIRISAISILKYQRKIVVGKPTPELMEKMLASCEGFASQLQTIDTMYQPGQTGEIKQVIAKMLGFVESLQVVLKRAIVSAKESNPNAPPSPQTTTSISSTGELTDKILEAFSEFQDVQYFQRAEKDKKIKNIIRKTKRNMMNTLIITIVGTMLFVLVVPGKIALPFKKINDAIRELQNCNFDVSIYYDRDDEIGEMASEINKMIINLKKFEELRAEKILIEVRKFDALANIIKKSVLVANARGEFIYLNNNAYSLLQLQSDEVLSKNMHDTVVPAEIIHIYDLAIKRRSKIDNMEIAIPQDRISLALESTLSSARELAKGKEEATANEKIATEVFESIDDLADKDKSKDKDSERDIEREKLAEKTTEKLAEIQYIFKGYANIIPIRGKESALDYYLMVLSEEILT